MGKINFIIKFKFKSRYVIQFAMLKSNFQHKATILYSSLIRAFHIVSNSTSFRERHKIMINSIKEELKNNLSDISLNTDVEVLSNIHPTYVACEVKKSRSSFLKLNQNRHCFSNCYPLNPLEINIVKKGLGSKQKKI